MQVTAFQGVVHNGQIRLTPEIQLPENAQVYVVVPALEARQTAHIRSPHLADANQLSDFKKTLVRRGACDADV